MTRALCADKSAAKAMLAKLETDARLAEVGLGDRLAGRKALLVDLLDQYRRHLIDKEDTSRHIDQTVDRIRKLLDACRFARIVDVEGARVAEVLAEWRRVGMAPETSNHYLRAVKAFWRWLLDEEKADRDLFRKVKTISAEADRRRRRRSLSAAEFARLIEAARSNPSVVCGLSGPDRAMLYIVASYTGWRASELASLTPASLDFAVGAVTNEAAYSKRRKRDVLPLHADLIRQLCASVATRPADAPLWPGRWAANRHGAEMLRADLRAAGIPSSDRAGRVFDFHALRGQFVTGMSLVGVNLSVAQKLARHSTPTPTANSYTRLEIEALRAGVDRLPAPPKVVEDDPQATGS